MTLPTVLLLVLRCLASILLGAVLGYLLARWLYSCRRIGHAWERYEIEGAHFYRICVAETFRICQRCGQVEIGEVP